LDLNKIIFIYFEILENNLKFIHRVCSPILNYDDNHVELDDVLDPPKFERIR